MELVDYDFNVSDTDYSIAYISLNKNVEAKVYVEISKSTISFKTSYENGYAVYDDLDFYCKIGKNDIALSTNYELTQNEINEINKLVKREVLDWIDRNFNNVLEELK